jgi:predicted acylesterase/phospholipase RssA
MQKPKILVLSGGGIKGAFQLGMLHYYHLKGELDSIETYSGTSVGSIICTLLSIGYTPYELYCELSDIDSFFKFDASYQTLIEFPKKYGLVSSEKILSLVKNLIIKKIGHSPTFLELYRLTGKVLYVTSANITKGLTVHFNYLEHPDLEVFYAVRMSCNLPVIFERMIYEGDEYVDGGAGENVPLSPVDDHITTVLCITTKSTGQSSSDTLVDYIQRIFIFANNANTAFSCRNRQENVRFVEMKVSDVPLFFKTTVDEMVCYFTKGYMHVSRESYERNLTVE